MVKNWMILGDEAFDSESKAVGVIRLAPDEMDDWQSVAWGRFADVVKIQICCSSYLTFMTLRKKRLAVFQRRCAW